MVYRPMHLAYRYFEGNTYVCAVAKVSFCASYYEKYRNSELNPHYMLQLVPKYFSIVLNSTFFHPSILESCEEIVPVTLSGFLQTPQNLSSGQDIVFPCSVISGLQCEQGFVLNL